MRSPRDRQAAVHAGRTPAPSPRCALPSHSLSALGDDLFLDADRESDSYCVLRLTRHAPATPPPLAAVGAGRLDRRPCDHDTCAEIRPEIRPAMRSRCTRDAPEIGRAAGLNAARAQVRLVRRRGGVWVVRSHRRVHAGRRARAVRRRERLPARPWRDAARVADAITRGTDVIRRLPRALDVRLLRGLPVRAPHVMRHVPAYKDVWLVRRAARVHGGAPPESHATAGITRARISVCSHRGCGWPQGNDVEPLSLVCPAKYHYQMCP